MNRIRERKTAVPPSILDPEDRFTSEGGALDRRTEAPRERPPPLVAPSRHPLGNDDGHPVMRATATTNQPRPYQLELMSTMGVDFLEGAYQHGQRRFLRLEDALNHAELLRRYRRKGSS
ncbi:hypothetical protein OOT46_25480 [Aquabacterium sp. A7-Y]|uniref:hypothetical protein n=1 Tax=Aquabacterium sp. A7-Y TaxID=1349605 RepID=UPI00223D4571|nr:hypothetical protein [Aquabacterium sp. A7-Y]MCW7541168.1 hypothetical protein [Aquabacterium sp. A7-Y]